MCLKNILIKEISPDVFLLVNTERKKSLKITVMFYSVIEMEMEMIVCLSFSLSCYNGLLKMAFSNRLLV